MSATIRAGATLNQSTLSRAADTDITAARLNPKWVKVGNNLLYTAFQVAATSKSNTLFALPAGGIIHAVKLKPSVAFVGVAISALTLSVGISGTLAKYLTAFDVVPAVSGTNQVVEALLGTEDHTAAVNILITAVATGANLSVLTAGAVDIWALLSNVDG